LITLNIPSEHIHVASVHIALKLTPQFLSEILARNLFNCGKYLLLEISVIMGTSAAQNTPPKRIELKKGKESEGNGCLKGYPNKTKANLWIPSPNKIDMWSKIYSCFLPSISIKTFYQND